MSREFEQSSVQRSDRGWVVLVNGFIRGIFPHGPWGEADAELFAGALDALASIPPMPSGGEDA